METTLPASSNSTSPQTTQDASSPFEPAFDEDGNQTLIKTNTGIWSVSYNGANRPITFTKGNICSRDFEGHLIDTPKDKTDLQFVIDIITAYNNFTSFPVYMCPEYDGPDRNCSTWVNVLFKTIGIPEKDRENLGEFRGIDWGEEDEDACFERMFKFRYPNSPILLNFLKIRSF